MRDWGRDLVFGMRLAVSGRAPWGRLALTAVGIGLGVAVLLLASSVQNMFSARDERAENRAPIVAYPDTPGEASVLINPETLEFRGRQFSGIRIQPKRPDAPVPPGVQRNPGPGQMVVSPALAELLSSPDGDLLRPRIPGEVVGTVGPEGLLSPNELYFVAGEEDLTGFSPITTVHHHYGEIKHEDASLSSSMWIVLALGVSALLVPVVVFVAATTRLAESARQRRLAALRLVGAGGKQVRRIASAEALVGALGGVVFGWALFAVGRLLPARVEVAGFGTYTSDILPSWWYGLAVTLGVPVVAVVTAIAAMRSTIIEPLSVVRRSPAKPRKLLWRCVPLVLGVVGLLSTEVLSPDEAQLLLVTSVVLMLIGVPLLLPWVVERVVHRLRGGSLSSQLAIRNLQLNTGTAARSVGAIAVVLTGVIGLQIVMGSLQDELGESSSPGSMYIHGGTTADTLGDTARALESVEGVSTVRPQYTAILETTPDASFAVVIADCAVLTADARVKDCQDGDSFAVGESRSLGSEWVIRPGMPGRIVNGTPGSRSEAPWTVPASAQTIGPSTGDLGEATESLLLTPRAAEGIPFPLRDGRIELDLDPAAPADSIEHVRNIAAEQLHDGSVSGATSRAPEVQMFEMIRYGLLLGALVTFALIGCSLFVAAAEQIQQRRRPTAVLAAVGVRRSTLGWSMFWQNLLPMLAAIVVATVVGIVLGLLVVSLLSPERVVFDPLGGLALLGLALASVLVVTALTLPALRRAMHPEGLRTE